MKIQSSYILRNYSVKWQMQPLTIKVWVLHLTPQDPNCCIHTKNNKSTVHFYNFWIIQKFLLIWNKPIQTETFETLRLQTKLPTEHENSVTSPQPSSTKRHSFQTKLQHLIGANHTQHVFTDKTITDLATSKLLSKRWNEVQTSYNRELYLG